MDKEALKKEIEIELRNLERLAKEMEGITERSADKPDFIETRAAASILHVDLGLIKEIAKSKTDPTRYYGLL